MAEQQISINPYRRAIKDMSPESLVRFQVMLHCYLTGEKITPYELDTLTLLGVLGECDLKTFIQKMVEKGIFLTTESSRNSLGRIGKKGFIMKKGGYSKRISLNPDMRIQTEGTILVEVLLSNYDYHGTKETV